MAVILRREPESVGLDPTIQDPERLLPLLAPYPAEEMEAYPVSAKVNNPVHDSPECVRPLA
jgi:putative SOS response-associated peptidase YedK